MMDRVCVLVEFLCDAKREQQVVVYYVISRVCRERGCHGGASEPVDIVGAVGSPSLDDNCTHVLDRLNHRRYVA